MEGELEGEGCQRDQGEPFVLREEGVEPNSRTLGVRIQPEASGPPRVFPLDEKGQEGGEVSECRAGFTSAVGSWT